MQKSVALERPALRHSGLANGYSQLLLYSVLCFFRIANALIVNSHYSADETQQSLNVAHYIVHGNSQLTWEWAPEYRLRSFLHVLFQLPIFYALKHFKLESSSLIVILPRVQQAFIAALGDFFTFKLAALLDGKKVARIALAFSLLSPFNFFHATRTLVTSIEASLYVTALYFWHKAVRVPEKHQENAAAKPTHRSLLHAALVFGILCWISPTGVIALAPVVLFSVFRQRTLQSLASISTMLRVFAPTAAAFVALGIFMDTYAYRLLHRDHSLPPSWSVWQFLRLNIIESKGELFGIEKRSYYITVALPLVIGPFAAYFVAYAACLTLSFYGRFSALVGGKDKDKNQFCNSLQLYRPETDGDSLLYVIALSMSPHKEIRYISACSYPLLITAARTHGYLFARRSAKPLWRITYWLISISLVTLCLLFSLLSTRILSSAVRPASDWVRRRAASATNASFVALTPCYRFPGVSYLGPQVTFRELSCEPSFYAPRGDAGHHHMDDFYANVTSALNTWSWEHNFRLFGDSPTYIAMNLGDYVAVRDRVSTQSTLISQYAPCALFPSFLKFVQRVPTIINPIVMLCREDKIGVEDGAELNWNVIKNYKPNPRHAVNVHESN